MWEKVKHFVSEHPLAMSILAGVVIAWYFYQKSAGSSATADGSVSADPNATDVAAASQLQTAMLAYNAQSNQVNAQAAVANNQISEQEIAANLSSQDTLAGYSATQNIDLANISASATTTQQGNALSAQTTQAVSLLQAQVAENQTAADVAKTQINANAYVDIASLPYTGVTAGLIQQVNANTTAITNVSNYAQASTQTLNQWSEANFGGGNIINFAGAAQPNYNGAGVAPSAYTGAA